jgi:hypothetical protein
MQAESFRPDLVGDGYDVETLLTASELAGWLQMDRDEVYLLPIPRIRLSKRRLRWRLDDVRAFLERRTEKV